MNSGIDSPKFLYGRLVFNRRLLVLVHCLVGCFSAALYLSRIDLQNFPYWHRRAAFDVILIVAPAIFPYVVSAVYSWRVVTFHRLRLVFFLLVLVGGAVLGDLLITGALGIDVHGLDLLSVVTIQAGVYLWAAEWLLHVV